jgi:hypothetical protein
VDLGTIRLRRTGTLAVEKSDDFPTARPFAHKRHSARTVLIKIRESQNQPPAAALSLFRPGSCPDDRCHRIRDLLEARGGLLLKSGTLVDATLTTAPP